MIAQRALVVGTLCVFMVGCGVEEWTNEGVTRAGLTKGSGGTSGVDTNYCNDPAFPCDQGESDCDDDAQCAGALVCGLDNGAYFGFGELWDVCVPAHCNNDILDADEELTDCGGADCGPDCTLFCAGLDPSPSTNSCSSDCPCDAGESDCNADDECAGVLVCGVDNGDQFGFGTNYDVCVPAHCRNGVIDADETLVDCGGTDCGPTCGADCGSQPPNGDANHCTATCLCGAGQGDCDTDAECASGSVCVDNVGASFGFSSGTDMCLAAHCTNGASDGDETGVDCGPSCVPCAGTVGFVDGHGLAGDVIPGGTAMDSAGNVIVAGRFFDDTNLGGSTFTRFGSSSTTTDIFIAKYDSSGAHLWSRQLGSVASDGNLAVAVAAGPNGEIALAGNFNGAVDFGSGYVLTAATATAADAFVAVLEADGTTRWAVRYGDAAADATYDVRFDSSGALYAIGSFQGTVDFGSGAVEAAGGSDIFVVKLAGATGATIASARFGGAESDIGYAVATQGSRVYIGGAYRQAVSFGSLRATAIGGTDAFLVEVSNSTLAPMRGRFFGGTNVDRVTSIDVDPALNVTATGLFGGSVNFGLGSVMAVGGVDVFVLATAGNLATRWVSTFGGSANDEGTDVSVDDVSRRILVTGVVQDTVANFPGGSSSGPGMRDSVLLMYESTGVVHRTQRDGGSGVDGGYGVAVSGTFYSYTGTFEGSATVSGAPLMSGGGTNVFVGRFSL